MSSTREAIWVVSTGGGTRKRKRTEKTVRPSQPDKMRRPFHPAPCTTIPTLAGRIELLHQDWSEKTSIVNSVNCIIDKYVIQDMIETSKSYPAWLSRQAWLTLLHIKCKVCRYKVVFSLKWVRDGKFSENIVQLVANFLIITGIPGEQPPSPPSSWQGVFTMTSRAMFWIVFF